MKEEKIILDNPIYGIKLKNYKVYYNGQQVPMYLVVTHVSEGNQQTRNFADNLNGKNLEVFTKLSRNGVIS